MNDLPPQPGGALLGPGPGGRRPLLLLPALHQQGTGQVQPGRGRGGKDGACGLHTQPARPRPPQHADQPLGWPRPPRWGLMFSTFVLLHVKPSWSGQWHQKFWWDRLEGILYIDGLGLNQQRSRGSDCLPLPLLFGKWRKKKLGSIWTIGDRHAHIMCTALERGTASLWCHAANACGI